MQTVTVFFFQFMELENKRELLDFWMTAVNYKQNLLEKSVSVDPTEAQTDALIIYDKYDQKLYSIFITMIIIVDFFIYKNVFLSRYFSLQATMPLGFSDKMRFQVEQNICREGGDGPQPDCFDRPCTVVYNFLSKVILTYGF